MLHVGSPPVTMLGSMSTRTEDTIALDRRHVAHNYAPLPVVAASALGATSAPMVAPHYGAEKVRQHP